MNRPKLFLATFMMAFGLIVISGASQVGGFLGFSAITIGILDIAYIIWDTIIKNIWQQLT